MNLDNPQKEYRGTFLDDLPHGLGILTLNKNDSFEGEWRFGKRHGKATEYYCHGQIVNQIWDNGRLKLQTLITSHPNQAYYRDRKALMALISKTQLV